MITKKVMAAVMGIVTFASVTGCGDVDFWGNVIPDPTPTEVPVQDTCATGLGQPPPAYDPYTNIRPADVRPGNSWLVVELEVRALDPIGKDPDYCIPIGVHVYSRPGDADTILLGHNGMEPGPFDFISATPMTRLVGIQYDPTEPRFEVNAPHYEVHLDAVYLEERDGFNVGQPMAFRCALKIRGATVALDSTLVTDRTSVTCTLTGNEHWNRF